MNIKIFTYLMVLSSLTAIQAANAPRQSKRLKGLAPEYGLLEQKPCKRRVVAVQQAEPNPYAVHYVQETGEEVPMCTKARTLDEIPAYCTWLAYQLSEQQIRRDAPYFNSVDYRWEYVSEAYLSLPNVELALMVQFMFDNARALLREYQWACEGVGDYNSDHSSHTFPYTIRIYNGPGLLLRLNREKPEDELGMLKTHLFELYIAFYTVIRELKAGWIQADPNAYPDVCFKKDESDYLFFVKPEGCLEHLEDDLVSGLLEYFEFADGDHFCCDQWTPTAEFPFLYRRQPYLWIKKDAFAEFQRIFNFEIAMLPESGEATASA